MKTETATELATEPKTVTPSANEGMFTVGLAANYPDTDETRFFLTPEACGMITSSGIKLIMESDAGIDISFTDDDYAKFGVEITDRESVLKADIVLSYLPPNVQDIEKMREGATLLCMMDSVLFNREEIEMLLKHKITLGVLDNMYSRNDDLNLGNLDYHLMFVLILISFGYLDSYR